MKLYQLRKDTPVKLGDDTLLFKCIDWWYGVFEIDDKIFIWFSPSQEVQEKDWIYFIEIN
jgi:hypothetical protein